MLCWVDVSWAFRPGLFPFLDEINNPTIFLDASYHGIVHLFPARVYNDRPVGWALVRLMADLFGYDYRRQVACLLAIHFANCGLAFLLFRRLSTSVPIAISGVALFGSLWTTAATATYAGAPFDVFCLFFLLGSTLALLSERRGSTVFSALLFLAALRSKELAIFAPLLFTVLLAFRTPRMPLRLKLAALSRRLWIHYLIAVVIGLRYLSLYPAYRARLIRQPNPYAMDFHITTVLQSLIYYASLAFGAESGRWQIPPMVFALALGAILGWAALRRRAGIAFGVCAFAFTLQPVSLMPQQRMTLYAYLPQVFLILLLCLLVEEIIASASKRERVRWLAAVCVALVCVWWCVAFRRSPYFKDRVNWTIGVRRASMRTAQTAVQLPPMRPETHVYVAHNPGTMPWLFVAGPCGYFQEVNAQRDIFCIIDRPSDQLRALYANDSGPKYLLDYQDDGRIAVVQSAGPGVLANTTSE